MKKLLGFFSLLFPLCLFANNNEYNGKVSTICKYESSPNIFDYADM